MAHYRMPYQHKVNQQQNTENTTTLIRELNPFNVCRLILAPIEFTCFIGYHINNQFMISKYVNVGIYLNNCIRMVVTSKYFFRRVQCNQCIKRNCYIEWNWPKIVFRIFYALLLLSAERSASRSTDACERNPKIGE